MIALYAGGCFTVAPGALSVMTTYETMGRAAPEACETATQELALEAAAVSAFLCHVCICATDEKLPTEDVG